MQDQQVRKETREDAALEDYVHSFRTLFSEADKSKDVLDMFLHVVKHTSRIAEAVRRNEPDRIADSLSDSMGWLFSFIGKLDHAEEALDDTLFSLGRPISGAIWLKYPDRCPACFGGQFLLPEVNNLVNRVAQSTRGEREESVRETVSLLKKGRSSSAYKMCRCLSATGVETRSEGQGAELAQKQAGLDSKPGESAL